MPAYRSQAEADIREPVVERLREIVPGCRIIHEINACGLGSNRIDVLAVGRDTIAAVEIKSERDKLDRLKDQIDAMHCITDRVFAAIHEKHLTRHTKINGEPYSMPNDARRALGWVWPRKERDGGLEVGRAWVERDADDATALNKAADEAEAGV